MNEKQRLFKWSNTSLMHATKLVFRSLFLLAALVLYIYEKISENVSAPFDQKVSTIVIAVIFTIYMIEMLLRFFPNSIESMGCQKIFKKNYIKPSDVTEPYEYSKNRGVLITFIVWVGFNLILGILYWTHVIDAGILILFSLAYGVCDMICILFFCPFQTWFMKNKCCNTCLIYNWDFAMMFTPLLFIPHWVTLTLGAIGLALAIEWEILRHVKKERFYEVSNDSLKCKNCKEKLCWHKTQLTKIANKIKQDLEEAKNKIIKK